MTATTNTGIYKVSKIGSSYFATFIFIDGETLFLSKPYSKLSSAEKRLKNHCLSANITLS
tara:strand:- start:13 stop:192 length:180 start_codon:yes stop_codon:yes gene_type:complete